MAQDELGKPRTYCHDGERILAGMVAAKERFREPFRPGAPKGNRNAWKHGGRSAEAVEAKRYLRMIARLLDG
jgi:hypothetical protein